MVSLCQPGATAEITFPPAAAEAAREARQSALYALRPRAPPPPAGPPPPPLEEMLEAPHAHRAALARAARALLARLRRRVEGRAWDVLTASDYIRVHKCKWALWYLGAREKCAPPPAPARPARTCAQAAH